MSQSQSIEPALVDATAAAIARWGLEGATLERIGAEAGLSRATIYRRRLTREQLVGALTARAAAEYRDAVWPALTAAGTAADRLGAALEAMCRAAEAHLPLLAGLFLAHGEVFHQPGPDALVVDVFAAPFERLLRDGAADGSLRDVDATVTATVLFNTVGWGYVHLRVAHQWDAERVRSAVVDLAVQGVRP